MAARKLGFIERILRGAPVGCKKLTYITLVHSGMDYVDPQTMYVTPMNRKEYDVLQDKSFLHTLRSRPLTCLLQRLQLEPTEERRRSS